MEYKQTLNVTLSDKQPGAMPQRANLPAREPEFQRYWESIELYKLSLKKNSPNGLFILHDGPPYSNGDIHLGHAINKLAKDIIVKYKTMQGFCSPYVPGWDNHGMPIENEVAREFRKKGLKPDKAAIRKRCREYAASFVEKQKQQFMRLGIRADWENPYTTMHPAFEAAIVGVFGELADKGFIYRGLKPVLWCASCETALADAEVEYADHTSNSIYLRFPILRDPGSLFDGEPDEPENCYVVAWTTTPWTIPANMALAVHPDEEYVIIKVGNDKYLMAAPLVERTLAAIAPGLSSHDVWHGQGNTLAGIIGKHPLFDRDSPVVFANYVTMEDGTGVVHTAPGHGKEDFETGKNNGLEPLCPVDPSGTFTKQAGEQFSGAHILGGDADKRVMDALREAGHLLKHMPFEHSYPHCWRCHSPLIYRATVQWFMNIDHENHREKSLKAIKETAWYPPVSINRISSMVAGRPDWCLSRQRAWGVGIPAFYCKDCGKEILSPEAIKSVQRFVAEESSDVWYSKTAEELLPVGFACPNCGGVTFDKETDILDVWFDSGSTHRAVLENNDRWPLLRCPADVYLEGSDQHRGWFNSSLMVSVAIRGEAPFKTVITNGFTVDENGKKMSKSLGNGVDPLKVMETYGADILRLWVASTDYFEDVRCGENLVVQTSEAYRRIRNTFRFLVNNLYDFDPAKDSIPIEQMQDLDRWALAKLDRVVAAAVAGYEIYEFHRVYHAVHNFCTVDLSAFYLDVLKDRLYCSGKTSKERRSAQTALFTIAETLARLLAPILSHTAEEVWALLKLRNEKPSVQLADFPIAHEAHFADLLARRQPLMVIREQVNQAIEAARQAQTIGNPIEAGVEIRADAQVISSLKEFEESLSTLFKVSQVSLTEIEQGQEIRILPAEGVKCARCWLVKQDVGISGDHPDLCARCAAVV